MFYLFISRLQHGVAARVEGWSALGLHLRGEGVLVCRLALHIINLHSR